ncbi:MAG: hypothetical protein JWP35_4682 [Caulobacter sp.]|nr:hypothetical protein [Caulobacter sp.]
MLRSPPRLARKTLSLLASLTLAAALSACATPTVTVLSASPCSGLVPAELQDPTPGADLPSDDSQGSWVKFGDAQTGQLDKANITKAAGLKVIKNCEARDAEAAKKLQPRPWWAIWRK